MKILNRLILFFALCLMGHSYSQDNLTSLKIDEDSTYILDRDTLILDEFVMQDNSELILTKNNHYIKVKTVSFGKNCRITGVGDKGRIGYNGRSAHSPQGICRNGFHGTDGDSGSNGSDGKSLMIIAKIGIFQDTLSVNLNGGDGGYGGNGGAGSSGSKNTAHCKSDGGNGGKGGRGGNGGNGGNLTLFIFSMEKMKLLSLIHLSNRGGYRGLGGEGGKRGYRGIGPSESISLNGITGSPGKDGSNGISGKPMFYSISSQP